MILLNIKVTYGLNNLKLDGGHAERRRQISSTVSSTQFELRLVASNYYRSRCDLKQFFSTA